MLPGRVVVVVEPPTVIAPADAPNVIVAPLVSVSIELVFAPPVSVDRPVTASVPPSVVAPAPTVKVFEPVTRCITV